MAGFEKQCGNCGYYVEIKVKDNEKIKGECHNKSPIVHSFSGGGLGILWPWVDEKDWCGEFKFKWEGR
jgi:hypothetical protein